MSDQRLQPGDKRRQGILVHPMPQVVGSGRQQRVDRVIQDVVISRLPVPARQQPCNDQG